MSEAPLMRAKFEVQSVKVVRPWNEGGEPMEEITARPVCGNGNFGPNGESEDNTFARYSPCGLLELTVNNPDLFGKILPGQKFYVDFTEAAE